ncbi:cysteine-rich and transmembrane domain-containing protein A [Tripterygium wilfordii]|uniref:Cysteine-rich and transmembrane domain-containing protein A n=1 Tax=Tripterygium wilfordii TaxID=458696 RepID=A0A7J7D7U5_TRIWF|nr:cysteine-rich and transmembrane domain-containing protein A [Tripterygium wilfordii]
MEHNTQAEQAYDKRLQSQSQSPPKAQSVMEHDTQVDKADEKSWRPEHPPPKLHSKTCCGMIKERMRKCFPITVPKKGDKSFVGACLSALCCCWLCDSCF